VAGGEARARAVLGRADARQPRDARVLQLLDSDGHRDVVGAAGHRVAGVAEGLGAGGAVVLEPAHRLVVELERAREREPALPREQRAEPEGVHRVDRHIGRVERVLRGVDQQVAHALVPPLPEGGAAHADDRHAVPDPVAGHGKSPLGSLSRAPEGSRRQHLIKTCVLRSGVGHAVGLADLGDLPGVVVPVVVEHRAHVHRRPAGLQPVAARGRRRHRLRRRWPHAVRAHRRRPEQREDPGPGRDDVPAHLYRRGRAQLLLEGSTAQGEPKVTARPIRGTD